MTSECFVYVALPGETKSLGFGLNAEPPAPTRIFNRTMDLTRLQEFADRIVSNEKLPDDPDAQQAHDLMNVRQFNKGAAARLERHFRAAMESFARTTNDA